MSKEEFAFEVFDLDKEIFIHRPIPNNKFPYDVDIRSPSAPAEKRFWIYWGSHYSIDKAKKMIERNLKKTLGYDAEARIVEAKTGRIIEVIK
jgi:hypothetical protein